MGNTYKYTTSRPAITSDSNYWIGSIGWGTIDLNTILSYGSGFWDSWGTPGNRPSTYTSHWNGFMQCIILRVPLTIMACRWLWEQVILLILI